MSHTAKRCVFVFCVLFCSLLIIGHAEEVAFHYPTEQTDGNYAFYQGPQPGTSYTLPQHRTVKNVILLIGDGMGPAQVQMARANSVGIRGRLYMETLPITARVSTYSADNAVTDSAAAGTALACGIKTKNGMVGMTPDSTPYLSILEAAQEQGMRTGLVATSTITHATPASFAGHVKSRDNQLKIAEQLIERDINVLFGGGRQYFLNKNEKGSKRKDDRDLIVEAMRNGYRVIQDRAEIYGLQQDHVLGLFQLDGMTTKANEPMLDQLAQAAIEVLNRPAYYILSLPVYKGFFLMVEGSQIDWRCHSNDDTGSIRQTLLFDQAVKTAMDFAVKDQTTLVVVTADHETGGLTLVEGKPSISKLVPKWTTKNHSGVPVPLYAYGPGADKFSGSLDNTDIPRIIAKLLGIRDFPRERE